MKILLSIFIILMPLLSRENPFFPADSIEAMPITSNKVMSYPSLKRVAISLPDQARVLEDITISYKNLDGSIEKKSIQVNRAVDWHIPIFISQSYGATKEKERQKINFEFINFTINKNEILINTKNSLIRNFLLVSPHRIVLDFKHEANFLSYEKVLKKIPFTKLRIGNHDGYYRVVISLDGRYRYETDTTSYGYRIRVL
ncbi:MAG: AMIN domain-containing protein [Campylobacterota bacterium]|nr:AMIN domain-containing protein [Campylobacterota bacterium]